MSLGSLVFFPFLHLELWLSNSNCVKFLLWRSSPDGKVSKWLQLIMKVSKWGMWSSRPGGSLLNLFPPMWRVRSFFILTNKSASRTWILFPCKLRVSKFCVSLRKSKDCKLLSWIVRCCSLSSREKELFAIETFWLSETSILLSFLFVAINWCVRRKELAVMSSFVSSGKEDRISRPELLPLVCPFNFSSRTLVKLNSLINLPLIFSHFSIEIVSTKFVPANTSLVSWMISASDLWTMHCMESEVLLLENFT